MENIYTVRDAYDALDKADFKDETSFLEAVAAENVRRRSPEYQEAYRAAVRRLVAERREAEQAANAARYKAIRDSITVPTDVKNGLRAEAIERANSDMRLGTITASQFDATVDKYVAASTEQYKDREAASRHMNEMFRGQP